mmetsp:Transcript_7804/g.6904  ORF Transcript_7804/g.6904 Transcript_7804/m.6904 type:complete len:144 (+) Transcript_7804:207-638(+)
MDFSKYIIHNLTLKDKYHYFKFDVELNNQGSIRIFHIFLQKVEDINKIEFIRISINLCCGYPLDDYYELYNLAKETKNFPGIQIPYFLDGSLKEDEDVKKIIDLGSESRINSSVEYDSLIHNQDFMIDSVTGNMSQYTEEFLK